MTRPPKNRGGSPASSFATALLDSFVRLGVRDVVLSPGSRSQALALAAAALEASGAIRLRVRIDERVGGFLALGLAVESKAPVLVITTSGTAVANLHPAVLEAHHSGVPLIVLSADRPDEMRGTGANQTTDQPGIFGSATSRVWDVAAPTGEEGELESAAALAHDVMVAAQHGPVQVNLAFREPLSSSVIEPVEIPSAVIEPVEIQPFGREVSTGSTTGVSTSSTTVVIAGHGAGEAAETAARTLGAPLFAEVSSGAHFGPNLCVAWRELMKEPGLGDAIERVIVFGHPTLSREAPALIQREGVETIVVRTPGVEDYDPGHAVASFVDGVEAEGDPSHARAWVGSWVAASRKLLEQHDAPDIEIATADDPKSQAAFGRAVLAGLRAPVTRRALVESVWRMTWPHDRLVLGASRLIREADRVVPGKKISVHANRGLAGIDGTISTAVGIALAAGDTGVTRVLLGDLAALHDAGGLLFGVGEERPRIQVIVGNDGGGTLFDSLEVADSADAAVFDRVLLTAQQVSFEALAGAYGWEYRRVGNRGELEEALAASNSPTLIEVPLSR
jgi:2-succinyl-5-enolpyruvyl-6-hydroxy-3-cyclohexene-1-carboxylate synthase